MLQRGCGSAGEPCNPSVPALRNGGKDHTEHPHPHLQTFTKYDVSEDIMNHDEYKHSTSFNQFSEWGWGCPAWSPSGVRAFALAWPQLGLGLHWKPGVLGTLLLSICRVSFPNVKMGRWTKTSELLHIAGRFQVRMSCDPATRDPLFEMLRFASVKTNCRRYLRSAHCDLTSSDVDSRKLSLARNWFLRRLLATL